MTTFKTPLPEKLNAHTPHWKMTNSINLLIDRVEELTAVVEGKHVQEEYVADPRRYAGDTNECICMDGGGPDGCNGVHKRTVSTHSLKEQLLGEIANLERYKIANNIEVTHWQKHTTMVSLSDVEALIERIIK